MNCDWVKQNITLYAFDELADDARFELERHVNRCGECAAELEAVQGFRSTMSEMPLVEPSPSLLAASRMRLQEALENAEQEHGWRRWFFDPMAFLSRTRFSPALAAVLLMVGFGGGAGVTYKMVKSQQPGQITEQPTGGTQNFSVASIHDIQQIPGTNKIKINYDTLVPQHTEGSLDDARVQQLLLYAARNNGNSGVRLDSINLLTQQPDDTKIREALKAALRYDTNPGVRIKALEALGPNVKDDVSVRDVIMEALRYDTNPGVRAEALHMLQPVKADGSVRLELQRLATSDKDQFIRRQSQAMLATVPEID